MTERRVISEVVDDDGQVVEIEAVVNDDNVCRHELDPAWCALCRYGLAHAPEDSP